jgi:hypothetical protein
MESSGPKRRFPPPWTVAISSAETFVVSDANGVPVAWVHHRDENSRYGFGASRLTADEARRIANAIARIPEFMIQRRDFHKRGCGLRWKASRPYHVALEDSYLRAHWGEIDALCKLNSLPFSPTGEKIRDGALWHVHEFAYQMDAILFWARFDGRWLRGDEFHYPERPKDLPELQPLRNWPKFKPEDTRR